MPPLGWKLFVTVALIGALVTLPGCWIPSDREYLSGVDGTPVAVFEELNRKPESYAVRASVLPKQYPLDNGNWIYESPERPDCWFRFEVNPAGTILRHELVGNNCFTGMLMGKSVKWRCPWRIVIHAATVV
jgi:hypothetical protein